ncbi:MAG TPA: CopG family transcriptional regulator [Geobacter sp.]|nr:CopG family transcriptional regulator [Geobacter sp.]
MRRDQNERKEAGKRKSPKKEHTVLKNVVSLRVSDQEKRLLERLTRSSSQSLSDLVREALGFWLSRRRRVASEPKPARSQRLQSIPAFQAEGI